MSEVEPQIVFAVMFIGPIIAFGLVLFIAESIEEWWESRR